MDPGISQMGDEERIVGDYIVVQTLSAKPTLPRLMLDGSGVDPRQLRQSRMKRLAKLLVTLAPLLVTPLHAAERPNILFIFCDDLTNQALSCLGDSRELLETPNIDRLAAQGLKFTRCLVPNSICGPSRATVLTGKYSHMNGFYSNVAGRPFDGAQQTFPKLLQKAGYQTAIIGKWHLDRDPTGFDQANPAETRNFIADPAYAKTVAELKIELTRLRTGLKLPPLDQEPRHAYGKAPFDAPDQPQGEGNAQ